MAFALLVAGIIMLVSAMRNTQLCLVRIVQSDFVGQNNFFYWIIALIVVGSIGYVEKLKKISDALLILIFVALFLSRGKAGGGDFFGRFVDAIKGTTVAKVTAGSTGSGFTVGTGGIQGGGGVTVNVGTGTTTPRAPSNPFPIPGPTPGPVGGGPVIIPFGPGGGPVSPIDGTLLND